SEKVQLVTAAVPRFLRPPPYVARPSVIVNPFRLSVAPAFTTKMAAVDPSIVMPPPPSMVREAPEALAIGGSPEPRGIVPLILNTIVSMPLPATQFTEPDWFLLLALVMASRRSQVPLVPGSPSVLTVIVLACSAVGMSAIHIGARAAINVDERKVDRKE